MHDQLPTLYLNRQRKIKKTGRCPLYFKHSIEGKTIKFQLKTKVAPDKWIKQLQKVKDDETFTRMLTDTREA